MFRSIVCAILAVAPIIATLARAEYCRNSEWPCQDWTCIPMEAKCDGKIDCQDESDETHHHCWNHYCHETRFRCAYGACVDGTVPCNGITECLDGSDEMLPMCRNETLNERFDCYKGGPMIPASNLCDGKKDCAGGEDESILYCGGLRCKPHQFQCAYGACVNPNSDCNEDGRWDCADGSDETDLLCNRIITTVAPASTPSNEELLSPTTTDSATDEDYNVMTQTTTDSTTDEDYNIMTPTTTDSTTDEDSIMYIVPYQPCKLPHHPSVTYFCGDRLCKDWERHGTEVRAKCNDLYVPDIRSGQFPSMICVHGSWSYETTCQLDINYAAFTVTADNEGETIKPYSVPESARRGPNERVSDDNEFDNNLDSKKPSRHFNPSYFNSRQ